MIEAIRNIGEYALEKEEKSVNNPLEILLDNPANRNTKNILFILSDDKDVEFKYGQEIRRENIDHLIF